MNKKIFTTKIGDFTQEHIVEFEESLDEDTLENVAIQVKDAAISSYMKKNKIKSFINLPEVDYWY